MISSMEVGLKLGQMVQSMKDSTLKGRSTEMAPLLLLMGAYIQETFSITKFQVRGGITGQMVKPMTDNGKRTKCMDMELSSGKTAKNMKATL
jgi:hypothetical protein